jgi:hypothetical protein
MDTPNSSAVVKRNDEETETEEEEEVKDEGSKVNRPKDRNMRSHANESGKKRPGPDSKRDGEGEIYTVSCVDHGVGEVDQADGRSSRTKWMTIRM